MRVIREAGALALVLLTLFGERTAAAQLTDPAAAEALFQEGRRLLKIDEVLAACSKFDESLRLDPAIGTLINVAACQERLGRTATAWQHWRAAADQLSTTDKRRAMAIRHASALEKVLARLIVTLGPNVRDEDQLEVRRDGIRLGRASLGLPLPLDPGLHLVEVLAPNRLPSRYEVMVRARDTRTLLVEPGPEVGPEVADLATERQPTQVSLPGLAPSIVAPSAPPAIVVRRESPASRPGTPLRTVAAWGLIGGGAVAAGVAGYFAFQALEARRDAEASCPGPVDNRVCLRSGTAALDRDRRSSIKSDITVAVGALMVGSGIFLLNRRGPEAARGSAFYLAPLPQGGEARLVAKF
jgi:hypothetical protein